MRRDGFLALLAAASLAIRAPAADLSSGSREDFLRRGRASAQDGLYALSERYFERALALSRAPGERLEAEAGIARALLGQRRFDEAVARLDAAATAARSAGDRADLAVLRARALRESDPAAAIQALRGAADTEPWDDASRAAAFRLLGRILLESGAPAEAEAAFRAFAERWPDHDDSDWNRIDWAAALRLTGRTDEAAGQLQAAAGSERDPCAARLAQRRLAEWHRASGRPGEALALLLALAAEPGLSEVEQAEIWLDAARIEEAEAAPDRAAAALERVAGLNLPADLRIRVLFSRGRLLLLAGETEKGRAQIRDAVRAAPESPESADSQLFLARHLAERGNWEGALNEYRQFLEAFPGRPEGARARLELAVCLHRLNRHLEAAEEYEGLLAREPGDPNLRRAALRGAADARFALGEFDAARNLYRRLVEEAPGTENAIEAEFQVAETLRSAGRPPDARAAFEAFLERRDRHPLAERALLHLAMIAEESERWADALDLYGRVPEAFPGGEHAARARLSRGLLLYRLGEFGAALEDFEEAARGPAGSPYAEQAWFMQGWCHALEGRPDRALELCARFVEQFPDSRWAPDVEFWIGETRFNRGDFEGAEEAFALLGSRKPPGPLADRALFWAGRAALHAKEYLRAIDHFSRLARDFPASPMLHEARYSQGEALRELGQFGASILAFEEILRHHPDSHLANPARLRIGDCHFTLAAEDPSRYEQALLAYLSLRDSADTAPGLLLEADFKIGRCLERLGRNDEALEAYLRIVYAPREGDAGFEAWFSRAAFAAAEILERQGAWREAAGLYRRVIEHGARSAPEAQERLNRIRFEQWRSF